MQIIRYGSSNDIDVKFLDKHGFIKKKTMYTNFKLGQIKNPYDKTVFKVGYLGIGKYKARANGNGMTEEYNCWRNMLERCYLDKRKDQHTSYFEISEVCKEWHNFQVFAEWWNQNKYEVNERLHIDKDILYPGNKEYSPEKCMLVPQRINMLFVNKPNSYGLPNGIRKTSTDKYTAEYNNKYLGTFNTLEKAYSIYAEEKEKVIKQIADEYKDRIPKKLYEALYNYKCDINNDKNYNPMN